MEDSLVEGANSTETVAVVVPHTRGLIAPIRETKVVEFTKAEGGTVFPIAGRILTTNSEEVIVMVGTAMVGTAMAARVPVAEMKAGITVAVTMVEATEAEAANDDDPAV